MKLRSLSIVAAGAILGLGLLSGCGGGSSGAAGAASSGIGASDGYVIKLDTNATAFCSDTNLTYTSLNTVGAKGALTFSGVTLTDKCIVTVPADAWIDADNNGSFNAAVDKQVGFAMRAPGDAKFVSQLTTYAVDANNTDLMALVKDFDPVIAAVSATSDNNTTANKAKKLLILGEALKTAYAGGSSTDAKTLNVSEFTDANITADNLNIATMTGAGYTGGAAAAITAKATAMQALVDILGDLKTAGVDVADAVVKVSDGGLPLATAIDHNISGNATLTAAVSSVDSNITHATTAVNALPAKLSIGSLKLGNQTVALNGNTFNTTVTTTDANISDFYNVSFPSVSLTKGFAQKTVGVSVKISDTHSNQVTLAIAGAVLTPNDTNTSVKIALPTTATVSFSETGLTALQAALGATSASTSITSALNPTDLAFNVDTILDSIGSSSIPAGLEALNTYLKTSGVYDVNITFSDLSGDLTTDYTSFVGKVTVKGDVTAPVAPTLGMLTVNSLVVTAEAGSMIVVKNGSTVLASAVATGHEDTLTFTTPLIVSTTVSVTATDKVGNVSAAATKTITLDTIAPAAPSLGAVTASSLVVTAEAGSTITIKNGSTPIATTPATIVATGGAQTVTFATALTANATLNVTATDTSGNISSVASASFIYSAPVVTFNAAMVNDVVNSLANPVAITDGSYTIKVKTSATTPAQGQSYNLYVTINGGSQIQVPINLLYAVAGTNLQIGVYSGSTLVAVSSVYTLTSADAAGSETVGEIPVTVVQ